MRLNIIKDPAMTGRENMEKDELLLTQGEPVLRFYSWQPACVSVGYFQNIEKDIDVDFCEKNNIDIIRRPTGGRAVLHDDEITYSLVLPETLLPSGVIPSYKKIADIFVSAFHQLGIHSEVKGPEGRGGQTGVCFAQSSAYEISVDGKKLVGSAQVRRSGMILQHGSILLSVDYEKHSLCMKGKSFISADFLKQKMAGIFELLSMPPSKTAIIEKISNQFLTEFDSLYK